MKRNLFLFCLTCALLLAIPDHMNTADEKEPPSPIGNIVSTTQEKEPPSPIRDVINKTDEKEPPSPIGNSVDTI